MSCQNQEVKLTKKWAFLTDLFCAVFARYIGHARMVKSCSFVIVHILQDSDDHEITLGEGHRINYHIVRIFTIFAPGFRKVSRRRTPGPPILTIIIALHTF